MVDQITPVPSATAVPKEAQAGSQPPSATAAGGAISAGPSLIDIINVLADRADPIIKLLAPMVDRYQKGQDREVRFQKHMAWVAILVVLSIVGVSAFLTYVGRIDGSTFTFLLGLIVGYVLTFIRDQIKAPQA